MPRRHRQYKINGIYHVYNRGIDKRDIFLESHDYLRMLNNLFVFNDKQYKDNKFNNSYHFDASVKNGKVAAIKKINQKDNRELFVDVLAFCLMPNHFHLLLRPKDENGVQRFMQKLGGGYSTYFNQKYNRSGSLFQGRYKCVSIDDEKHFDWISHYIHANPLDLEMPEWREGKLNNLSEAMNYLNSFRWSSHGFYSGNKKYEDIVQEDFLKENIGFGDSYIKNFKNWLSIRVLDIEKSITFE